MNIKNSLVDIFPRLAFAGDAVRTNKTFNIQIFIGEILTEVRVNWKKKRQKYIKKVENCFSKREIVVPLEKTQAWQTMKAISK